MPNVLILDDDTGFAKSAGELARQQGFQVYVAHTVRGARQMLAQHRMDLLLLDLHLPDGSGMDLLDDIDLAEHGRIAVVTGSPTLETAMRAVSAPVLDYLLKPLCPEQFTRLLSKAVSRAWPSVPLTGNAGIEGLVGSSEAIAAVVDMVHRIAPADASVLIAGESGTGKELVARALHDLSGRRGAFVAINCGAVPSELLASQLFGHEKGSFTGAHSRHMGVFEQAAHGTLLLDEISEMPAALQVYLLRVLESGSVTRVGGIEVIRTPVRVVAATNRDPRAAIANGTLREDLYYRLADISLELPPLRQRGDDAVQIARALVQRLNSRYSRHKYLAPGSELAILRYRWPGNVRELRSAVQRAYLLEPGDELHITPSLIQVPGYRETDTEIVFSVGMTLADLERQALLKTLAHFNNDKSAAARALGISVRTIHNHLARLEAEESSHGSPAAA